MQTLHNGLFSWSCHDLLLCACAATLTLQAMRLHGALIRLVNSHLSRKTLAHARGALPAHSGTRSLLIMTALLLCGRHIGDKEMAPPTTSPPLLR